MPRVTRDVRHAIAATVALSILNGIGLQLVMAALLLAVAGQMRHICSNEGRQRGFMEQDAIIPILKPCPFCGDRPQIVQTGIFMVQCADCGAAGPPGPSMERAAVRWNKRKGDEF